jgi:hypothetical protein
LVCIEPGLHGGAVYQIEINNDGVDEILVVGRETKGFQRGPAFQLFDGSGALLVTQFVLNGILAMSKPCGKSDWRTTDRNWGDRDNGAEAWPCLSGL